MPWWGWMITGTLLLGAEMLGVSAQFYLVFVGAAAIVVGLIGALGIALPDWAQWLTFAGLAVVCMVTFRGPLYQRFRGATDDIEERLTLGDYISVPARLEPGAECRVEYRGTTWTARNVDALSIEAGGGAEICKIAGLTLHIRNPRSIPTPPP